MTDAMEQTLVTSAPLASVEMGIGTWAWGDRLVWGYGASSSEESVYSAYLKSLEAGIRFFDTAELYGRGKSEKLLGQFMRASNTKPMIATKFMPLPWRFMGWQLLSALRGSLKRLGLAHVDLYQIHWPNPPVPVERWANALADAVEAGLARAVGVSNYSADETRRAYDALAKRGVLLASNQVDYSLLQRGIEQDGTMRVCRELGVRVIAYSPLAMGLLTGKYTPDKPMPGYRGMKYRQLTAKAQPLIMLLSEIGERCGKTPSQVALNWTICKSTIPIPGAKNAAQAEENAGAIGWRLTPAEVIGLDEASARALQ
jgi:aryl-alcohol dehydrogenase-like predicted oxidoreductase